MGQLIKETLVFRVETEDDAKKMIDDATLAQGHEGYTLTEAKKTYKNKKVKGEIVDEWFLVSLTKRYDEV